jgi:hypothetical protein
MPRRHNTGMSCVAPPGHVTQLPHHVTHSQHRQPLTPHETSTTILPPPSCSSAISRFARRLCGMHKFGSSVNSCVCVSFCAFAPCRRVRVEQRAPRLSCLEYTYTSRVGVVPRRCRRGVGRRARLRGKGLQIFCYLPCHDATTHHTMLEDFRSPRQVHPLAVPSRTGIPLKPGASRVAAPDHQTSSPPSLASSASRHHLLLPSVFPQCADRLPLHRGCRRPVPSSFVLDLEMCL